MALLFYLFIELVDLLKITEITVILCMFKSFFQGYTHSFGNAGEHAIFPFQRFRNYISGHDKRTAQVIGVKLRNLLKLPKAHKWVCYEWFYSNLDL